MEAFLAAIGNFLNTLGPLIVLPIVITILGIILGQRWDRAFRSGLTIAVAFVGIVLLLVVSIAGIMVLNREKYYKVEVDGNLVNVSVKPFKTKAVYSSKGEKVGDLRGTLIGRPQVKSVNKGTDIRLR